MRLADGETVLLRVMPSWRTQAKRHLIWVAASIIVGTVVSMLSQNWRLEGTLLAIGLTFIGVAWFAFKRFRTRLVVTNMRAFLPRGPLGRAERQVDLTQVQTVTVNQRFGQRFTAIGELVFEQAGTGSPLLVTPGIGNPQRVAREINALIK